MTPITPDDFSPLELLPSDGDLTPDEELQAALGQLDITDDDEEDAEPLPFGRGWGFDFETGQMARHGIAPVVTHDLETLRIWIEKTLRTARGAHPIYSLDYGVDDPYMGIGSPFSAEAVGLLTDSISDALLTHDRIEEVVDIQFTGGPDSDVLFISFSVIVDDEELTFDNVPLGES